jgi:hypothetical protein
MLPRPTDILERFATALLRREEPTGARNVSGFESGDPVPPLTLNWLIGLLVDSVLFLLSSLLTYSTDSTIRLQAGTGPWIPINSNTTAAYNSVTPGIKVEAIGVGSATATRSWGPVTMGGTIEGGTVTVVQEVGNAYTFTLAVRGVDATGTPVDAQWGYSGNDPGTFALVYGSGATVVYGPLELVGVLSANAPSGGSVTVSAFTLELSAP